MAPDLRGHGDSQWSADGSYTMAGYVYDLAQLVHQQKLAPVTIIAHSLGGNVALRYAGIYPEAVAALVAIEGLGPSPSALAARRQKTIAERMDEWIGEQRGLAGRLPRRYATIEDAFRRMQEENPHLSGGAGAPPDRPRREPERGRHLQLEVRQLRPRLAALRHGRPRHPGPVVPHRPAPPSSSTAPRAAPATPPPTAAPPTSTTPTSPASTAPATGSTTTASTSSSASSASSSRTDQGDRQ